MKRFLAIVMLGGAFAANALDAAARLAPPEIPWHHSARLTIEVTAPADTTVEAPNIEGALGGMRTFGDVERRIELLEEEGMRRVTLTYELDPVMPGTYPIEPLQIDVSREDAEEPETAFIPGPTLFVRQLSADEAQAAGQFIEGDPLPMPPRPVDPRWIYGGMAALALALAIAAFVLLRKRKELLAPAAPPKEPWERALELLAQLEQSKLADRGQVDQFYVVLSDILRQYIERRFRLHAPERTTQEFLEEARQSRVLTKEQEQFLARLLRLSDKVKFAKHVSTLEEMQTNLMGVRRFVEETVPRPEPEAQEAQEKAA